MPGTTEQILKWAAIKWGFADKPSPFGRLPVPSPGLAPANAAPPVRNEATVISHVKIDKNNPSVGYVRVRYTCEASDNPAHLWVSGKQTADGSADPALLTKGSGFGNVAATWLQSHPTLARTPATVTALPGSRDQP